MRRTLITGLLALTAAPLMAQGSDPDNVVKGATGMPAGWVARLDRANANAANVKFVTMGSGYHATLGPAGIFYYPAHTATGSYTAKATFSQTKAATHPEAYGLFVGGRNLNAANQEYLYFIVRQDGKYMVKHRAGSEVHTIADWTDHPAINKMDAQGKATNALAIRSTADSIVYLVNGRQVYGQDRTHAGADATNGQVGLRVNHNLDVHIADFAIVPAAKASATKISKDAKKP
jgi:hypothetical protein